MRPLASFTIVATILVPLGAARGQAVAPAEVEDTDGGDEATTDRFLDALQPSVFADLYYAFAFGRPADGDNFPDAGTSGKRHNTFGVNLVGVGLDLDPTATDVPVGFRLWLQWGTGAQVLRASEVESAGVGTEVLRSILFASVRFRVPPVPGLEIEVGVMEGLTGFESYLSWRNVSYTRAWQAELIPYSETGLRVAYDFGGGLRAELHLINGWNTITDVNDGKTLGVQLSWSSETFFAKVDGLFGPELPDEDTWRVMGDTVLSWTPVPRLSLTATGQAVWEEQPGPTPPSRWGGGGLTVAVRLVPEWLTLGLRGELFADPDGAISVVAQDLFGEVTTTLDFRIHDLASIKLEARYDRSAADVFGTDQTDDAGAVVRAPDQWLVLVAATAYVDPTH